MSLADRQETPNAQGVVPLIWPPDYDDDGDDYYYSPSLRDRARRQYTDFDDDDDDGGRGGSSTGYFGGGGGGSSGCGFPPLGRRRKRRLPRARQFRELGREGDYEDDDDDDMVASRGLCSGVRVLFERVGFIVLAAFLWCGSVYLMLRWQRFPFHRHKVEVALICVCPVVIYTLAILLFDRLLTCLERRKKKAKHV